MIRKFIQVATIAIFLTLLANIAFAQTPTIEGPSRNTRVCVAGDVSIKVIVTGVEVTSYQWYKDGTPDQILPGETTNTLFFTNVTTDVGGFYFCRISYAATQVDSDLAEIIVIQDAPSITSVTIPTSVCENAAIAMNATISGSGVSAAWYKNNVNVVSGYSYSVTSASESNAGTYYCVAENVCGSDTSESSTLSVVLLPEIITQPVSQRACEGQNLEFEVVAEGSDLQYQWVYNSADYPSTNGSDETSTLLIESVIYDQTFYSNPFSVEVSNSCATVTSNNIYGVPGRLPIIVGNPVSETACEGTSISLYANATTNIDDTLIYQWYVNESLLVGAVSDELNLTLSRDNGGTYYCEFTNGCGSVNSTNASIAVKYLPFVETQPNDTIVCVGSNAVLTTKITGFDPISYQWMFNYQGDYADVYQLNVSGENTQTMTISAATQGNASLYFCYATNECGSVRTDTVEVAVNTPVIIYPQPSAYVSICEGELLEISLDGLLSGSEPYSFAWYKTGSSEVISTSQNLEIDDVTTADAGSYYCEVSNICGTVNTNNVSVSIKLAPRITEQPDDVAICEGDNFSISLEAVGNGLHYSWYRNGNIISAATTNTYNCAVSNLNNSGNYNCVVSSDLGCASAYSDTITVEVGTIPTITWQPTPATWTVCENEQYDLTLTASGEGVHYQWFNNGIPLAGQTEAELHMPIVTTENDGIFYCIVGNACQDLMSQTVTLNVNSAPEMTLGPDLELCHGSAAVLAPLYGEFNHYSWNNGQTYQPSLSVSLAGDYILEVTDSAHGNCVAIDTIRVNYHDYFDIEFDSDPIVTCGDFVLNAGEGAYSYEWSTGAETNSIVVTESNTYSVTVDGDGAGCTSVQTVIVTIGEELTINLGEDIRTSEDSIVEIGVSPVFSSYIWNTGFDGPKLTVSGAEYGVGAHNFWLEVSNGGCSARDTIKIIFMPSENDFVEDNSIAELQIFPNPTTDYVNVVSENVEISEIVIYDAVGRIMLSQSVEGGAATLNVADFAKATYFIKVLSKDNRVSVTKILIQ